MKDVLGIIVGLLLGLSGAGVFWAVTGAFLVMWYLQYEENKYVREARERLMRAQEMQIRNSV